MVTLHKSFSLDDDLLDLLLLKIRRAYDLIEFKLFHQIGLLALKERDVLSYFITALTNLFFKEFWILNQTIDNQIEFGKEETVKRRFGVFVKNSDGE